MTLSRSERGPEVADARVGAERGAGQADAERMTRTVELDATPAEVWDALTEEVLLAEWLADEVEIEAEPGGEIVCRYADGEERRGEVELVEEAERLAWSWRREGDGPSRVELVLDAVAERTRLTVIESPVLETGALATVGPLLVAGAVSRHTPLHAAWGPPLARLRVAVHLVLA
ncbi:MAG TPA: SRPBCC domain-containing protein [Solirubrobacterales bacterium]|nr:SRPBCC domain-containing protein [Solirubrobacterales bacterium]